MIGSFIACFFMAPFSAKAQGNLMIFPKRVVFENGQRFGKVNLSNTGKDTARYQISFVNYRMNENGTFTRIAEPDSGQRFASPYVRFFPRRVVLAPGESQVVRLQLTRTSELQPGEYRSHMYFRSAPSATLMGGLKDDAGSTDSTKLAIRLRPIYGITIPVIIRIGTSDTQLQFSTISLTMKQDTIPVLHLKLNRTGNMSVHGNIEVQYEATDGKITPMREMKGVSVYTPNTVRDVVVQLPAHSGINWTSGKLNIRFTTLQNNRTTTLAQTQYLLY